MRKLKMADTQLSKGDIAAEIRRTLNAANRLWLELYEDAVGFDVKPISKTEFTVTIVLDTDIYKEK